MRSSACHGPRLRRSCGRFRASSFPACGSRTVVGTTCLRCSSGRRSASGRFPYDDPDDASGPAVREHPGPGTEVELHAEETLLAVRVMAAVSITSADDESRPPIRRALSPRRSRLSGGARRQLPEVREAKFGATCRRRARSRPKPSTPARRDCAGASRPSRRSRQWAEEYRASRVDLAPATRDAIQVRIASDPAAYRRPRPSPDHSGDRRQPRRRPSTLKPSSPAPLHRDAAAVLDYAGVDPNPAKDKPSSCRGRSTRRRAAVGRAVAAIVSQRPREVAARAADARRDGHAGRRTPRARVARRRHGRVRFRVRGGKTPAARRWVAVPESLMGDRRGHRRTIARLSGGCSPARRRRRSRT